MQRDSARIKKAAAMQKNFDMQLSKQEISKLASKEWKDLKIHRIKTLTETAISRRK